MEMDENVEYWGKKSAGLEGDLLWNWIPVIVCNNNKHNQYKLWEFGAPTNLSVEHVPHLFLPFLFLHLGPPPPPPS